MIDAEAADAGDDEEEDNGDGLEDDDEDGAGAGFKRRRKAAAVPGGGGGLLRPGAAATALMAPPAPRLPKPQAPIQPGATPEAPEGAPGAGARFLAYNAVGCVVSRRADGHRTVEVAFHDAAARGGRAKLPLLADYYGFDVAALGEEGVLYGSPKSERGGLAFFWRVAAGGVLLGRGGLGFGQAAEQARGGAIDTKRI